MDSQERSKSDGHPQQPKAESSSKSVKEDSEPSSTSELYRRLNALATGSDSDEEDLEKNDSEENDLKRRELRRQRRMRVREKMEKTRGVWNTERNKLATFAETRLYMIVTRDMEIKELRTKMKGNMSLDDAIVASVRKKRKELKELRNTFVKKITKRGSRESIIRALKEELNAFNMLNAAIKKQIMKAEAQAGENRLKVPEVLEALSRCEVAQLWRNEAERWLEELEIPTLAKKFRHSPIEFTVDDAEYLITSVKNFKTHQDWCIDGPRLGEGWYYTNRARRYECDDCKDDVAYQKSLQESQTLQVS